MRLVRYITEESSAERVEFNSVEEIADELKRKCAPYLREFGTDWYFYRGVRSLGKNDKDKFAIFKKKPRMNRKPMNMRQDIQDYLNKIFKKKFGWMPRNTGVFATHNYSETYTYGYGLIFMPIGQYKYIYNPDVDDLFINTPHRVINFDKNGELINDIAGTNGDDDYDRKKLEKWKKRVEGFRDSGMKTWLSQRTFESMWRCKEYYLIDPFFEDELTKLL